MSPFDGACNVGNRGRINHEGPPACLLARRYEKGERAHGENNISFPVFFMFSHFLFTQIHVILSAHTIPQLVPSHLLHYGSK